MRRTVVLTSRENFVWLSMQEIIPLIEKNWKESAAPGRHEVVIRNVDRFSIPELMPELLRADQIVFTCFTVKLARIGELLRKSFGLEARYFVYLHHQATILCWPLHAWGMGALLREDDVFIASSAADARAMRHSFPRCRVEVIPFTLPGLRSSYRIPPSSRGDEIPFVYAGRISAQKNLHTLLYAFRLFADANPGLGWKLSLYGKEDHLGSPNMGMRSTDYGRTLRGLVRDLRLGDRVSLAGYRDRGALNRILARERHVAVSTSLHSDENFGMSPFRSLVRGNLAVLSRWGGFADFERGFPGLVFLAPVAETERGPWVDPRGFARLLSQAADAYRGGKRKSARVSPAYLEENIARRLRRLAAEPARPGALLKPTPLARRILEKRETFEKLKPGSGRIFESYADPDARAPFRSYRMERARARSLAKELICAPWVVLGKRSVQVRDPHRGSFSIALGAAKTGSGVRLTDWQGRTAYASRRAASRLASLGYAR
ncbi:MAG TPA: glycosyltransferase family 4 protein [Bdellovibrionota bacterium]|nr:glycosyltransferase family 4 protein [Bdellovibrionota bacterium]